MFLTNLWTKIQGWFKSPKVKVVLDDISKVILEAKPIVEQIASLVPNKTFQQVVAAYEKYGVPFAQAETGDPLLIGNYLLNLATTILTSKFPGTTTSTIQTAVQLAVSLAKAGA